jgi:hypothetical protein
MKLVTAIIILLASLYSTPVFAVWDYSLAAQLAIHDGMVSTCGKTEPRLRTIISNDWLELVRHYGMAAIRAARASREYSDVYREILYEQLKNDWGDSEEEAHACERVYISLNHQANEFRQWWRDRSCVNVQLDPDNPQRCGTEPHAGVSFANIMTESTISILRINPSADVSFPDAGILVGAYDPGSKIVSPNAASGIWSIPESVEFEWKEWPRSFPTSPKNERELANIRLYANKVRSKVQRKYIRVNVRSRIPTDIIAKALEAERTEQLGNSSEPILKILFVFTKDSLRLRWEQWHDDCIENFGGDVIDLPRHRLLLGDIVCNERQLSHK